MMKNKFNYYTKSLLLAAVLLSSNYMFAVGPGVPEEDPTVPIDNYIYVLGMVAIVLIIAFRKKIAKQSI